LSVSGFGTAAHTCDQGFQLWSLPNCKFSGAKKVVVSGMVVRMYWDGGFPGFQFVLQSWGWLCYVVHHVFHLISFGTSGL